MATSFCVLRTVFLLLLGIHLSKASTIFVSPRGNDSALHCGNISSNPCATLDFVFSGIKTGENSTQIFVAKGLYLLKQSYRFYRVANFTIVGENDVEINCMTNVSLSFVLSVNVSFDGIKFKKCGGWRPSSVYAKKPYSGLVGVKFKVALDFRYCRNLRVSNVEVLSSPGLGLNCYDVGGVVIFVNCSFVDNTAANNVILWNITKEPSNHRQQTARKEYVFSGGGVYLALDAYGSNTVRNITPEQHDWYQHNNSFIFRNCSFVRNEAIWLNASNPSDFVDTPELPFSRGGGLAIYFRSNASGCAVAIESCLFSGNRAHWGGALQLGLMNRPENNHLTIKDTRFENNEGVQAGGGARLSNLVTDIKDRLNTFTVDNCLFVNNSAIWGGGVSIVGSTIAEKCASHSELSQFIFNDCQWENNTGTVGSAFGAFLLNKNEDQIGPEVPYHISINGCTFKGNFVRRLKELVSIGEGAFYSIEVPLLLHGNVTFINNTRTALALDGATLEIFDQVYFIDNTGFRGGGMAMYGRSRVVFHEDSLLLFDGNKCLAQGGALYIDAPGPPLVSFNATGTNTHICFFKYTNQSLDFDEWETKVVFRNNKAPSSFAGNSIYATTLKNCRRPGEPRQNNSVLRWNFVEFKDRDGNASSREKEVSTDPVDMKYNSEDWQVAPGEPFNATLRLIDELGGKVHGVVNVKVVPHSSPVVLASPSSTFISNGNISFVRLFGKPGDEFAVQINYLGRQILTQRIRDLALRSCNPVLASPSSTFISNGNISFVRLFGKPGDEFAVQINYLGRQILTQRIRDLALRSCNPGFAMKDDAEGGRCVCVSSTGFARGVAKCLSDGKTIYLKRHYWGGIVNGQFVTYVCPTGYCKTYDQHASEKLYNASGICNDDRDQKSILCGDCKENRSVLFGGEVCSSDCSNCYQVMKVITPDGFKFDGFIEFIIGLANFQLRVGSGGICFAKGLDHADELVIMYARPTYVIVLVILLAKAIGWYPNWCFSRRLKGSPFRAFCTIVVLSYTDITRISLRVLHPAALAPGRVVMYAKGSILFFTGKHIAYSIVALLFILLFVIPFPLILLFRPFLTKRLRPILNLNRWNPIFDALQNCFKNQYRWCAAFYFLCRLVLLAIATFMTASPLKRALLEGSCAMILLTIAYLRPYKEAKDVKEDEESYEWINQSDAVLLATLTLIAIFSSLMDSALENSTWTGFYIVVEILAYVPLLVCAMVAVRTVRKYRREAKKLNQGSASVLSFSDPSDTSQTQGSPIMASERV
ncbi:PREDICTED: uncharacterized protein LOC107354443 [Acropora digitifera]|uniref:uncharacterized protein LOC107354443 n=1 Tax=Acropora digitifera TaxID=70779 RepID=UPI00077A5375|nr:PREDICTED: uncharacterized protein LOC107354443 [Acropora digitifera]